MFVRTKDNIYEITDKQHDFLCGNLTEEEKKYYKNITAFSTGDVEKGTYKSILIKDIINQSRSPFALCDEFVVIRNSTKINQLVRTDNIKYLKEMMKEDKRIIAVKGAIWTDWGLKYVAQVNESGGLDLDQEIEVEE